MNRWIPCLATAMLTLVSPLRADESRAPGASASTALRALFDSEWERGLAESPENASFSGDARFNDRWTDLGRKAIEAREAEDRAALQHLRAIDRATLSAADQLDYDVFEWQLQKSVERQKFHEYLQPISHQGGVQTADGIAEVLPFANGKDYRDWLSRLKRLPELIDQTTALMREGIRQKNMPPRVLMERVPAQIAAQIVDDPSKSPFYRPFLTFADGVPDADREALRSEAKKVIAERVVPSYRKFARFFDKDYLPHTRASIAVSALPDGKAYYEFLAGYYTTTDLDAARIHEIGLAEVARIKARMESVKDETGFKGSLPEFFTYLRSDPKFFEESPAALLERYRATAKRIDPELVKVFHTIPRLPYGVRPIPDNIAPDTTTAYYQPGATDGSRPGYYYVNLYKPEVRPTWEMMPLSLHEAVPGHHFQFARGLELPEAPMFRRTAYFVAYSEGWGLYAEQLGFDMGLYDDPYDHFGQLTYEMWRAVRLVVDTGMHSMGWSRDKAIAYFRDNAAKTDQDIVNEIDRYIGTPGQALAYKIGQLKISELRARAEKALGDRFDLRAFDDAVLDTGSVPLAVLEKNIDAWIAAQRRE
ncbi:DUF885 domain-containing protein [Dokdonella immobilis]|uniref:Uncharacterized conserved protein, DUF885 familyt n=1 Tax=Dokdonella immobilis TaxID=578942 RepID=A0A1I4ZK88_9GAMM|nr:DUF885 domain-containing protein [Dokdonella immobilis]SFN50675.1 Uncharacterized conserved protein, DUF885 familyt [Dokdonella immobilis]